MRFTWFFYIGLSIAVPFALNAQNTAWQALTIADGLSQGMVYDFLQDRTGFMWIATKDGLNRYDGYNFKVFTHDPYNPNSISGNTCTALLEDSRGRLWIGTEKDGLNLYDPHSQRFYRAEVSDQQNNTGNYSIIALKEDSKGNIWVITDTPEKIFCISNSSKIPAQSNFSTWLKLFSKGLPAHTKLAFDRRSIAYPRLAGLYRRHSFFPSQREISTLKPQEYGCLQDRQGRFWAVGPDSLICWQGKKIRVWTFVQESITQLSQLPDGRLAIANSAFLWLFTPTELLQQSSLNAANAYASFPSNVSTISTVGLDASGNVWAGTRGYGLLRFNPLVKKFHSFLPGYSPAALYQDQRGHVYFHANYWPEYQFFQLDQKNGQARPLPAEISSANWGHDALVQDKTGHFWVITHYGDEINHYLMKYTQDWQLIKKYSIPPELEVPPIYQTTNFHHQILQGRDKNIWIGWTNGSLVKFDPHQERFEIFSYRKKLPKKGALIETFALYQDKNEAWWIGTQRGLIKAENLDQKAVFTVYKNDPNDRNSLSNDFVSSMIEDPLKPADYLWVSTKGGGLERFNKKMGVFEHFTEAQGLPNKVVYGVVSGADNNLWISTNRGLARLNLKTLTFNHFNKSDGLQEDEFNTNSFFHGLSGQLLFGGINGITIFRPRELNDQKNDAKIRLLDVKINNRIVPIEPKGVLPQAIEYLSRLQLAHHQNLLSFEFGLMDFTNPVKNRYRYKLDGIDRDWVEAGTQRFANYAHLASGHYTFQVMGSADGEQWSAPTALQIRIYPPFYRTWWAYSIYALLFFYLAFFWYQSQMKRVRLQEQVLYQGREATRLAELDALKTRFFTNISHELRTPLTLILGPLSDMLKRHPEEKMFPIMQRNALRLKTLINQLLDLSKLEAGQLEVNAQQGDLAQFLRNLMASFESLAKSKNLIFHHEQSHSKYITYFDADKIEKIVTNLLSNAIKFSSEYGRVELRVDYSDSQVAIKVQDFGIGIESERIPRIFDRFYQVDDTNRRNYEGTGIGLALVKELTGVLKGEIKVDSIVGHGSTFTVLLPHLQEVPQREVLIIPGSIALQSPIQTVVETAPTPVNPTPTADDRGILLIVEDNPDLRTYICSIFANRYQVIEAKDGQEGLEKTLELLPDLVICDLMMPRLDGFSFCSAVKSNALSNHIPVVMLTAKATLEDRLEGLELGADDYLAKPFNTVELETRVNNLIKQRQILQQKYSQALPTAPTQGETTSTVKVLSMDEKFMQKVDGIIEEYLNQSTFDVDTFAREMQLTPVQLRRKLKALTNQTITEYVRNYRLDRAAVFLQNRAGTVSEIAYQVGFESLPYFSKVFFERYGQNPSEWK